MYSRVIHFLVLNCNSVEDDRDMSWPILFCVDPSNDLPWLVMDRDNIESLDELNSLGSSKGHSTGFAVARGPIESTELRAVAGPKHLRNFERRKWPFPRSFRPGTNWIGDHRTDLDGGMNRGLSFLLSCRSRRWNIHPMKRGNWILCWAPGIRVGWVAQCRMLPGKEAIRSLDWDNSDCNCSMDNLTDFRTQCIPAADRRMSRDN